MAKYLGAAMISGCINCYVVHAKAGTRKLVRRGRALDSRFRGNVEEMLVGGDENPSGKRLMWAEVKPQPRFEKDGIMASCLTPIQHKIRDKGRAGLDQSRS